MATQPVELILARNLVSRITLAARTFTLGPARIDTAFVNHRGPTLGYRITDGDVTIAYIPVHEPALGQRLADSADQWISGLGLARDADLLIHDAQYTDAEYVDRVGWGHSALGDALTFARRSGARRLALFHHDPQRDDAALDALVQEARAEAGDAFDELYAAREGDSVEL